MENNQEKREQIEAFYKENGRLPKQNDNLKISWWFRIYMDRMYALKLTLEHLSSIQNHLSEQDLKLLPIYWNNEKESLISNLELIKSEITEEEYKEIKLELFFINQKMEAIVNPNRKLTEQEISRLQDMGFVKEQPKTR